MIARSFARNGWTFWRLAMGMALVAIAVAVTWQVWVDVWRTAIYHHDSRYLLLVLPVAGWIVWVRRERWRFCVPSQSLVGPSLTLCGAVLFLLGRGGLYPLVWHGGGLLMVFGAMLSVVAPRILLLFGPSFGILLLLIPLPIALREQISAPLQRMLVELAWTLDLLLRQGRADESLAITSTHWTIARACGSLEVIVSMILLCSAFAFGRPLRPTVRIMMVLVAPVAAISVGVAGLVAMTNLAGRSPEWSGYLFQVGAWSVLAASILFLLGFIRLLVWASVPIRPFALASEEY